MVRGQILVIDDEPAIRSILRRMLGREHEVIEAGSGAEARQILGVRSDFDVILCDLMMPQLSGADLHRWLTEADPVLAHRLVFITGGVVDPAARAYLQKLDNVRVQKPFDTPKLVSLVRALVQASKRRRESTSG